MAIKPTSCFKNLEQSKVKDANILIMSLAFFCTYASFFVMGNVQTVIIDNAMDPNSTGFVEDFSGDGFISLSIIYGVSFFFNMVAPAAMALVGLKTSMVVGSITFAVFIASFLVLSAALLYTASAVLGVGTSLIWVAEGAFLSLNSDSTNIDRNAGIFFMFWTLSGVLGNTYSYVYFKDSDEIDGETRQLFVTILLVVSSVGIGLFCLLLPMPWTKNQDSKNEEKRESPAKLLKKSAALVATRDMACLIIYFVYIGLLFTFWTGVYGPSLTFAHSFDQDGSSGLTGLHGIMCNVGGLSVSILVTVFSNLVKKIPRSCVIIFSMCLHLVSFVTIVLNVPAEAPTGETYDDPALLAPSSVGLAMFASYLLGFGAIAMETQSAALLGSLYAENPSYAFAVMKACHHGTMAISFAYAGYLSLYWQVGILVAFGLVGAVGFTLVDLKTRKSINKNTSDDVNTIAIEPIKF